MKKLIMLSIVIVMLFVNLPVQAEAYSDYLNEIIELAKERYYQDVSEDELIEGALKGIFGAMDEYTTFYNMEEASTFWGSMEGNYQGIGVEIMQVDEGILITRVFSNSPAEGAGLLPDDIITQVDGTDIKGLTAQDASNLIRGEAGTYVKLGIIRNNSEDIFVLEVQRHVVNISPVTWRADGDVMYIKLSSFSGNSTHFFEEVLKEMDKAGIKKMILDLRNNPGGEVNQAVNIARYLVRMGVITTLDFKSEQAKDMVYRSFLERPKYIPAILTNGNTASASEILAGAVQDSKDGFLVGTTTYGKGVVQNLYPILKPEAYEAYKEKYGVSVVDGYEWINQHQVTITESELIGYTKITTGHYLTRSGEMIHGKGIIPDFIVEENQSVNGIDVQTIDLLNAAEEISINGVGNDVYHSEKMLLLLGYEVDSPDNTLDERTGDAIKLYQQEKDIPVTGILDGTTKQSLNEALIDLRFMHDDQYAKAMKLMELFK